MKLRNKKTGEIKDWSFAMLKNVTQTTECKPYASLAELNDEWGDCEEVKDFYYVQADGDIHLVQVEVSDYELEKFKRIGNYFKTREEAVQALDKLKAIRILKYKGVYFELDKTDKDGQPIIKIKRHSNYTDYPEDILDLFDQLYILFDKQENVN